MKTTAVFTGVLVVSSVIIWDVVAFAGGYSVFPLFGALFLILPFVFLVSCWTAVFLVITLFRKRLRLAAILAAVVCLSWALSPWFLARSAFLHGLAARVRISTTPAEIESAAQLSLLLRPAGGTIFGPKRSFAGTAKEEEENKRAWDALSKYGFVHLADDLCVISVQPPDVSFEWGGSVLGHWGIRVLASMDRPVPEYYLDSLRYSDTVLLFVDH